MEESYDKDVKELSDLYKKVKGEIRSQYDKDDRSKQSYFDAILKIIDDKIENVEVSSEAYIELLAKKASIIYELAKLLTTLHDQNENMCIQLLKDALILVQPQQSHKVICYLYFRILNLLSYTLSKIGQLEEARKFLEDAEIVYESIGDKDGLFIYNTDELFENVLKANNVMKFEKLITNNFQIQAWIYNKMNQSKKFIQYHHMVLNRQLETQDGNAMIWFYKCVRLGVYFFGNHKFSEGKQHLAAACSVLREYEMELLKHRCEPHFPSEWNNLKKYYADLGKYWSKYGLFLFNASRHLATGQLNNDTSINDILIHSFQDSPSSGPAREWFNIRKNSSFFADKNNSTNTSENTKDNYKENQERAEATDQKQKESCTKEGKENCDLINNTHEEIDKVNEENNESEEIADLTKMMIDALDDRQKEVEIGDQKFDDIKKKTVSNIDVKQHSGDQYEKSKSESNITTTTNEFTKTAKYDKADIKNSCASNNSDTQSSLSRMDDDIFYEFKFPSLDLSAFGKIPSTLIDNIDIAREFFLYIQEWIKRAKLFYTIQDHPHEYIQLVLDLNELYRYLVMYETDLGSQYDIQKRRVDILETLSTMMKDIRPQEYLFIGVELIQELIQAQIELLMLNIRRLNHVPSSGGILLKDLCQEHDEASRKMEALTEIQRRLGKRDTRLSLIDMQMFGSNC